ncbi:hypothetical protein AB0O42_27870 [Streptomyces sp. NPDC089922]|uniref:hypothetical protein n=1 Tax=Streptomyces sp. NPDC089922 TaxID=3155189 RepID=UPI003414F9DF
MTINDAIRRVTQKRLTGKEEELGEVAERMVPGWSESWLRGHLGDDILAVLMEGVDWPQLSRRLVGLQQAGVDPGTFLPQMGRMTAGVRQAVVAGAARMKAEGTDRWADLLKATLPEGVVRDAILAFPAWPEIAAGMGWLDARGIDVARILVDACRAGVGVGQAAAAVAAGAAGAAQQRLLVGTVGGRLRSGRRAAWSVDGRGVSGRRRCGWTVGAVRRGPTVRLVCRKQLNGIGCLRR